MSPEIRRRIGDLTFVTATDGNDRRIVSGESGAATAGLIAEGMRNPALDELRERIGLNGESKILCFSTEGDTDRESCGSIVWDGCFPGF